MKLLLTIYYFSVFISLNLYDRSSLYNTLSGSSLEEIEKAISNLEKEKFSPIVNAYKGALYMKKASLVSLPNEKLKVFKKGKELLENEIAKQPDNIEMRLLRLIIQENSPKILKYKSNLEEDKNFITHSFKNIEKDLKIIIKDYSKTSKILNPKDFS